MSIIIQHFALLCVRPRVEKIADVEIFLPSLDEQNRIIEELQKMGDEITTLQTKLKCIIDTYFGKESHYQKMYFNKNPKVNILLKLWRNILRKMESYIPCM